MKKCAAKPTLLVLRHHGLGDLITAQPTLRALRRRFPEHLLVVTCPSWLVPLAEHFGTADRWVSEFSGNIKSADTLIDASHHQRVDAVLLENVLSAVSTADVIVSLRTPGPELLPMVANLAPRVLVSYRYDALLATAGFPELDFSYHILTRWRRLLGVIGVEPYDDDGIYTKLDVPDCHRGFTIVHAGAGSPARLWPVERWAEVVCYLESVGHRVVLTGSTAEASMVADLLRRTELSVERDRSGTTEVMELARLVAGARLVLCGNTGISHLATAFRRPAVTLFGTMPPAWWGPPPGNPQHRTLWSGRFGDPYGDAVAPGLLDISVSCVLKTINEMHKEGTLK